MENYSNTISLTTTISSDAPLPGRHVVYDSPNYNSANLIGFGQKITFVVDNNEMPSYPFVVNFYFNGNSTPQQEILPPNAGHAIGIDHNVFCFRTNVERICIYYANLPASCKGKSVTINITYQQWATTAPLSNRIAFHPYREGITMCSIRVGRYSLHNNVTPSFGTTIIIEDEEGNRYESSENTTWFVLRAQYLMIESWGEFAIYDLDFFLGFPYEVTFNVPIVPRLDVASKMNIF